MSSPGSNTGNEYIHELLSHLEDAARNGFNTKPGDPEPHRDLMIADSDKINQLFRNAISPKNQKATLQGENKTLRHALTRAVDEMEHYPVNTPTCPKCTDGQTPDRFNKGLCGWHYALAVLKTIPEATGA